MKIYLVSLCFSSVVIAGDYWYVPRDCETIQAAIDVANDGDEIVVSRGVWKETIQLTSKRVYLRSEDGAEETVIQGNQMGTVVSCTANANSTIEGFTIRGGKADLGGGIFIEGSSTLFRLCMIDFNIARQGGGVYVRNGTPIFYQCVFSFNEAEDGDGIWSKNARPELTACIFAGDAIGWESGELVTVRDTNSPAGACCIRDVCIQTASVACWEAGGLYRGENSTCLKACDPICDEDVTGDGVVNVTDVLRVISAFGFCP